SERSTEAEHSSVSPKKFTSALEREMRVSRQDFKPSDFDFGEATLDQDRREVERSISAWPSVRPKPILVKKEDEDTVGALTYAAATSQAIVSIGDKIARISGHTWRKMINKLLRSYRLSQEALKRTQAAHEKRDLTQRAKYLKDQLPPFGIFRKETLTQIGSKSFFGGAGVTGPLESHVHNFGEYPAGT
ncbi:MAG: hypothetical protein EZS28_024365, partial [Streblomastix strix]